MPPRSPHSNASCWSAVAAPRGWERHGWRHLTARASGGEPLPLRDLYDRAMGSGVMQDRLQRSDSLWQGTDAVYFAGISGGGAPDGRVRLSGASASGAPPSWVAFQF